MFLFNPGRAGQQRKVLYFLLATSLLLLMAAPRRCDGSTITNDDESSLYNLKEIRMTKKKFPHLNSAEIQHGGRVSTRTIEDRWITIDGVMIVISTPHPFVLMHSYDDYFTLLLISLMSSFPFLFHIILLTIICFCLLLADIIYRLPYYYHLLKWSLQSPHLYLYFSTSPVVAPKK